MLVPMWGSLRGLARLLAVLVTAAVAGLLALVGAATVTARPGWFLAAGLGVFLAAAAAGVALATRRLPDARRRRARLTGFAAVAVAGVAVFVVAVLVPVGDPRLPSAPVAGQRQWALPTGSRIAYVHRPAAGRPRPAHRPGGGPRPPRDPPRWCSSTAGPGSPTWPATPPTSGS
jgi:proline iminopeptidase